MTSNLPVNAVIVNFRTPDLTLRALSSFTSAYPGVRVILIDNGSGDKNGDLLERVRSGYPDVETVINKKNLHHGPAMHQGIGFVSTPFALFLDSDSVVLRPGFIELMVAGLIAEKSRYAAGSLQYVNKRGFPVKREARGAMPYINPYCMLIKKELYHLLPPFALHGSPVLRNIEGARKKGFGLVEVKLEEYVRHDFRGTAGRFGYRLGIRGRVNFLLNKLGL